MFKSLLAGAGLVGALAPALSAQFAKPLLSWDRSSGIAYNDIWGMDHTDPVTGKPTGRSFVIVGETRGIWLLETTDKSNIKQVKWWSAPSSTWRDFTNIGNYFYVSTENRNQRGFRVIDMSDPNSPVDVGYVQTSTITNAHNVSADPQNGFIYFSGSNQGVAIYDVKADPRNPKLVANWKTEYVHDICIRRNRAYFSLGRTYQVRILNASNPTTLSTIGNCNTPGGYAHNSWISEDDKLLCCTDEIARGSVSPHMTVWDVSNPGSPVKQGDYDLGSSFIAHNVYVIGRTAFMSHYIDGVHVIDLADPTNPDKLAHYDTSTVSNGYAGAWGCYPFEDSGVIYGSDIENGFYALQIERGHMNRYGEGSVGTSDDLPRARFDGASPRVDASKLRIECSNLEPNGRTWIVVSAKEIAAPVKILGANLNVDMASGSLFGPFSADAKGELSIPAPVPGDNQLAGGKVYLQLFTDRGDGTLASSKGMWAGIAAK